MGRGQRWLGVVLAGVVGVAAAGCGGGAVKGKNSGFDRPKPVAEPAEPEKKPAEGEKKGEGK
jgi:hypothetical protein